MPGSQVGSEWHVAVPALSRGLQEVGDARLTLSAHKLSAHIASYEPSRQPSRSWPAQPVTSGGFAAMLDTGQPLLLSHCSTGSICARCQEPTPPAPRSPGLSQGTEVQGGTATGSAAMQAQPTIFLFCKRHKGDGRTAALGATCASRECGEREATLGENPGQGQCRPLGLFLPLGWATHHWRNHRMSWVRRLEIKH